MTLMTVCWLYQIGHRNEFILLPHRRSTTVSLETFTLYSLKYGSVAQDA